MQPNEDFITWYFQTTPYSPKHSILLSDRAKNRTTVFHFSFKNFSVVHFMTTLFKLNVSQHSTTTTTETQGSTEVAEILNEIVITKKSNLINSPKYRHKQTSLLRTPLYVSLLVYLQMTDLAEMSITTHSLYFYEKFFSNQEQYKDASYFEQF